MRVLAIMSMLVGAVTGFRRKCLYELDEKHFDLSELQRKEGWVMEESDSKGVMTQKIHFNFCGSGFDGQCPRDEGTIQSYYEVLVRDQVKQECLVLGYYETQQLKQNVPSSPLSPSTAHSV